MCVCLSHICLSGYTSHPHHRKRAASYRYIIHNLTDSNCKYPISFTRAGFTLIFLLLTLKRERESERLMLVLTRPCGNPPDKNVSEQQKKAYNGHKYESWRGGGIPTEPESVKAFLQLTMMSWLLPGNSTCRQIFIQPSLRCLWMGFGVFFVFFLVIGPFILLFRFNNLCV